MLSYGERLASDSRNGGLVLLSAPGNDPVATTALTAAGAQLILFTTGRGTPFGAPAPTVKISSNTDLAKRKPDWIDFDAGVLLSEDIAPEQAAESLLAQILEICSGKQTCSERSGNRQIAIWKDGVTL